MNPNRHGAMITSLLAVLVLLFFWGKQTEDLSYRPSHDTPSQGNSSNSSHQDLSSVTSAKDSNPNKKAKIISQENEIFFQASSEKKDLHQRKPSQESTTQTTLSLPFPQQPHSELKDSPLWESRIWQVWKNIRVVPKTNLSAEDQAHQLGQVGAFIFVQDLNYQVNERQFSSTLPMAVFNNSRNKSGLITGTFKIVVKDLIDLNAILADHDLHIKGAIESLKTYYVYVENEPFDLIEKSKNLKRDVRLQQAELEVVSAVYGKK